MTSGIYTPAEAAPFTVEGLAERWNCSRDMVYDMLTDASLIGWKLGGKLWRVSAAEVARYESGGSGQLQETGMSDKSTIMCMGRCDGMGDMNPNGSYVRVIYKVPGIAEHYIKLSEGSAAQLADELSGAVGRIAAPLPAWLGPDTPERRMQLQMFVETIAQQDAADEAGKCPECGSPHAGGGDGSYLYSCDCAEPISADEADASPAVLRAMLHLARLDASRAEAELYEMKKLAPAHRPALPVVTMMAIADDVVKGILGPKVVNPEAWGGKIEISPADLHSRIMKAFDKEIG